MEHPLPTTRDPEPEKLALQPFDPESSWLDRAIWVIVSAMGLGLAFSSLPWS